MSRTRIDCQAWWQLLRAANVFTAMSNVIAGFLLVQRDWQPLGPLLLLILSSVCLYEAGMVLNDVFDAELDAVERPERPIPSGRISKGNAYWVGLALLSTGILAAGFASAITEQFNSLLIAISLTLAILSYDAWIKSTLYGALVMGVCRFLNVLLGASVSHSLLDQTVPIMWAIGIGIYTIGITLIARREASQINFGELAAGGALVGVGLFKALLQSFRMEDRAITHFSSIAISLLLLGSVGILIFRLLKNPGQTMVRKSVGSLISLFIPIDAAVCAMAAGWWAGFCVLLLLIPVCLLRRWTGQT